MADLPAPPDEHALELLDTLGFDGRVWVDVDGLVATFRARASALDQAAAAEPEPLAAAALHGRATELDGRADALALGLLDEAPAPHPVPR